MTETRPKTAVRGRRHLAPSCFSLVTRRRLPHIAPYGEAEPLPTIAVECADAHRLVRARRVADARRHRDRAAAGARLPDRLSGRADALPSEQRVGEARLCPVQMAAPPLWRLGRPDHAPRQRRAAPGARRTGQARWRLTFHRLLLIRALNSGRPRLAALFCCSI